MVKSDKNIAVNKAGLPPGSLIHVGKRKTEKVKISVINFDQHNFKEFICETVEDCFPYKDTEGVTWINIDGLHNIETIEKIGKHFDLHPLLLEDVLNTNHRPKVEDLGNHVFLTLKMLGLSKEGNTITSEQVSFILGNKWVISFQEQQGDVFDSLRIRLKENKGIARQKGVDFLLYRLIDMVVDNYFFVTDHFSEATEDLEIKLLETSNKKTLHEIQRLKKLLIDFRKSVTPLRDGISSLQKQDISIIKKDTTRYLHDVYEHIIQLCDNIDTQRDLLASITDLYLSGISNKTNQVMQVLTIISTIFIPLTFIAGIYGMNFDYMPELHWKYGYLTVWGIMVLLIIIMVIFFKRKKWL